MDTDLVVCDAHEAHTPAVDARDVDALRAALTRETLERRRAQALANIQTNVVKFAVDLLVREPDIEGFFRALLRTLAEEGESHKVSVWLIDEDQKGCDVWMAHLDGQVFTLGTPDWKTKTTEFPRQMFANHLFSYEPGWRRQPPQTGRHAPAWAWLHRAHRRRPEASTAPGWRSARVASWAE